MLLRDVSMISGPIDNNAVAAKYRGSPGGILITDGGKKKEEDSFGMHYIL